MNEEDELDINPFFKALQDKSNSRTRWRCSVRNKSMVCGVIVTEKNGQYKTSDASHIHPPDLTKKLTSTALSITTFSKTYDKAQENCCLICVPKSDCLQRALISEKFIKVHILKPSPFFTGQYLSLYSDKHVVCMSDDGSHVYTQEGFPTRVKIKILSEELGYNKDYKPYKILIIERPLDQNILKRQNHEETNYSGDITPKYSLKECKDFLSSFSEFTKYMIQLDDQLRQFNQNYVLLLDYLDDAVDRLYSITSTTSEKCLKSCQKKIVNNKFKDVLNATVETYVMASVHSKLFPVIRSKYSVEDRRLYETCVSLSGLTPDQLNVPEHFCCPLPTAVVELANIDRLVTPVEKLYSLKTTFDNLTQEINCHIALVQPPGISIDEIPCLTSDDLIPILVTVIVRAKCTHLHSDIFYMENFNWSASAKDRDSLSYCLVTFKAAVQYMTSAEFNTSKLHKNLSPNELSLEEITALNSRDKQMESPSTSKTSDYKQKHGQPRTVMHSRLDQQLENIAKMLDETSLEENLEKIKRKSPIVASVFNGSYQNPSAMPDIAKSDTESEKKKKDKGDFLNQLENDIFLCS